MRALRLTLIFLCCLIGSGSAQHLENIDEIGNFSEGLLAINKNNSWGFIDVNGTLVVDFRTDIAAPHGHSPIYSNGLCLIKEIRENIWYYGYINTKGDLVIPAEYIVATAFENDYARVIKPYKTEVIGTNMLGKDIVSYSYHELLITTTNKMALHISGPHNLWYYKLKLQQDLPMIHSTFISPHLIAVKEADRWKILKIE
ncbi:WG repeat-containing protein [Nonlabens sp.]|uniref:WG repeat-containing protein n=1 Tax=Nonlabens sp. TaxID=1888209 RepID=UPI0025FFA028|nr:WG repeat-containing protein [Nonlabens sp.]